MSTSFHSENTRNGFTLVETLVAITILLLVVVGPITVAQKGIKSAYYANEQVTAVFLAQEAIEAIRILRDEDALSEYNEDPNNAGTGTWDWYDSLANDCKNSTGCAFNVESGAFGTCGSNASCDLYIDDVSRRYVHDSGAGQDSGYTRKVYVTESPTQTAASVRVEVTWQSTTFSSLGGSAGRELVLETWVYDHYQRYEDF